MNYVRHLFPAFPLRTLPVIVTLVGALVVGFTPTALATRKATGSVKVPPSGNKVDYTVTVARVPGTVNQFDFWLRIMNRKGNPEISLIACAMVRRNKDEIDVPQYNLKKDGNVWKCERDGFTKRPPSFHMGCKTITLAAGKDGKGSFHKKFSFGDGSVGVGECELTKVYWDILQAVDSNGNPCTLSQQCKDVLGRENVNLGPKGVAQALFDSTLNLWGGNVACPEDLTPAGQPASNRRVALVETGNWHTMAVGGEYPARLVGTLTDAHPGALFAIEFPDNSIYEAIVPADGIVKVDHPMVIPADPNALMKFSMQNDELIAEGDCPQCSLEVIANSTTELYESGQFMHSIHLLFPVDSVPPIIDSINLRFDAGSSMLNFEILSTDASTMPASASVRASVDGSMPTVIALEGTLLEPPDREPNQTRFEGQAGPFQTGSIVTYEVLVVDALGNLTSSGPAQFVISSQNFLRGDSNGDGTVDVTDPVANLGFQFVGTFDPPCRDALDFDDSGELDVTDPIANLTHQFLGGPLPAPPGKEACGVDPTDDELGCESFAACPGDG